MGDIAYTKYQNIAFCCHG